VIFTAFGLIGGLSAGCQLWATYTEKVM